MPLQTELFYVGTTVNYKIFAVRIRAQ